MLGKDAPCLQTERASDAGQRDTAWAGCTVQHFTYDWQTRHETPAQRHALLEGIRRNIADRVRAHLQTGQDSVLVVATPPGTGKSTAVAVLGDPEQPKSLNLAWIAERHEMAEQVEALRRYTHIQPCTRENCPDGYRMHEQLLQRGLPTFAFHLGHAQPCAYVQQFHQQESAFYQVAHVRTAHPAKHPDGIVIDELNLEAWLEPCAVTRPRLLEAREAFGSETPAWRLLTATLDVLHAATVAPPATRQEFSGKQLFEALDASLDGDLLAVLEALRGEPAAIILYPLPRFPLDAPDAAERLNEQPESVLAHLWHGLAEEMHHYRPHEGHVNQDNLDNLDGAEMSWNSRLRVGRGQSAKSDWVLFITTPRRFKVADDAALPPRIVLDGTADSGLLRRLLCHGNDNASEPFATCRVAVPEQLPPPPTMRHIAVRLRTQHHGVKRYNISSVRGRAPKQVAERAQVIAEVRQVLERLDADGTLRAADTVGLITFKHIEAEVREALGIPERLSGHFWGVRGSNRFAGCELLLVVGRPRLPEGQVVRMAHALYVDDDTPLDTEQETASDGTHHFRDPRLEQLDTYLTRAELTQCAHRNRPLIFDHRTVVTFCDEAIGFLPVTTEVEELPRHPGQLSDEDKLENAAAMLAVRGQKQTVRALQDALKELYGKGLSTDVMTHWHKAHPQHSPQAA